MLLAILSICSAEELEETDSEGEVRAVTDIDRKQEIKQKILAVGRMQKVFQLLRYVCFLLAFYRDSDGRYFEIEKRQKTRPS